MANSITAQILVQNAFEIIGIYGPGETLVSTDSATGLYVLNMLLDEWAGQGIFVQQYTALTLTLVNAKSSYTVGNVSGVDLTAARPTSIEYGPSAATATVSAVTTLVNSVSAIEWAAIQGLANSSGTPDTIYYDPQYPKGVLQVSPTPNAGGTLLFNAVSSVVSTFAVLSTSYNIGLGGQMALQNNLGLSLISYYKDLNLQAPPRVQADAAEGKDFLRYNALTTRATLNRRMITTGRQPPPPAKGE